LIRGGDALGCSAGDNKEVSMRSIAFAIIATFGLALGLAAPSPAAADGCYICTSGSSCGQYCRYPGRDSSAKRKACRKAGCKIGGTASCPRAANVRICSGLGALPQSPWRHASAPAPAE
jgi:hypothetical protein